MVIELSDFFNNPSLIEVGWFRIQYYAVTWILSAIFIFQYLKNHQIIKDLKLSNDQVNDLVFLYGLIFGLDALKSVAPQKIVTSLIALGFLLYAGVGIVTQLLGANFLEYGVLAHSPKEGQHIGIILVEIGVGITVAAVMIIIFYMFAGRKQ